MNVESVEALLSCLGADRISRAAYREGEMVRSSCPLAPWLHRNHADRHPSFAVLVQQEDESWCRCFACGFKGTLRDLVWRLEAKSKKKYPKAHDIITLNEVRSIDHDSDRQSAGIYSPPGIAKPSDIGGSAFDPIQQADRAPSLTGHVHRVQEMIDLLDEEALAYLHGSKRNLNDDAIRRWKIGWHPGARRVSVPQYDRNHRLVNIGGRHVPTIIERLTDPEYRSWEPPPWMHAKGFRKEMFLFGEDKFDLTEPHKTMFLVEGMFDVISLDMRGLPNVGAMCGSYLSPIQQQKIIKWFERLVIIPDGDVAGYDAADRIRSMMGPVMAGGLFVYDTPEGLDPDQLSDDNIQEIRASFLN